MSEFDKDRFECNVEKDYWAIVHTFSGSLSIVGFGKVIEVSDDQKILGIIYVFGRIGHVAFLDRKNVKIFRKEEKEKALEEFCRRQGISFEILKEILYKKDN